MEMINDFLNTFEDPLVLVYYAPVVLGLLYLVASVFGETGK